MHTDRPAPWWDPAAYADRRPFLLARARILASLRAFFATRGFVEVETPILQRSPGNEVHLHAFATDIETAAGERERLYLHTSPEFACKKLIAGGVPRLFTLGRVFRNGERSRLHHPEFTMLEWYRANAAYETLMDDCAALLQLARRSMPVARPTASATVSRSGASRGSVSRPSKESTSRPTTTGRTSSAASWSSASSRGSGRGGR